MKKRIKYIILTLGLLAGFGLAAVPVGVGAAPPAYDPLAGVCTDARGHPIKTAICNNRTDKKAPKIIKNIVNVLLFILAAVSVVVIIIAGITYTTSGGNATLVTKAKNTLLYAVVGLIVAIMAYAIVNYVITSFTV